MTKHNTRIATFALLAAFTVATPAFADDTSADVSSDVGAIKKDNGALAKDNANVAQDRAAKAQDKVNGTWGKQAVDSVKIGGDQTVKGEKETEKSVDQKILNHDANEPASQNQ